MKKIAVKYLVVVLALFGMATARASDVDWEAGAKHGWIVAPVDISVKGKQLPNCLEKLSDEERENKHFVKIRYKHVRRALVAIAEIPTGLDLKAEDEVEVFPGDCDAGKVAHIVKKLAAEHQK